MTANRPLGERSFGAVLWMHNGSAAWHFVTLPTDLSDEIDARTAPSLAGRPGFGSIRVEARIGATTWHTSLFPDARAGAYVLPVKKPVRTAEQLTAGDDVTVTISVVDEHRRR